MSNGTIVQCVWKCVHTASTFLTYCLLLQYIFMLMGAEITDLFVHTHDPSFYNPFAKSLMVRYEREGEGRGEEGIVTACYCHMNTQHQYCVVSVCPVISCPFL